jgi:hypothetical protein
MEEPRAESYSISEPGQLGQETIFKNIIYYSMKLTKSGTVNNNRKRGADEA